MATTIEQLEQRLAAVERELAELREQQARSRPARSGKSRRKRAKNILELADEGHDESMAILDEVLAEMGIKGQPVGAKRLQQMFLEAGFDPKDNSFSREIIAMREE